METIKSLKNELNELDRRKAEVEEKLKEIITDIIEDEAQNNPHNIKKLGKNISVVSFKDFINKPWSQTYFDYEKAIEPLAQYLSKKPVYEWAYELQKLLDSSTNDVVTITTTRYSGGNKYNDKEVFDADFIQKIVERLEEEEMEEEEEE
jgi:hypothetical protein